MKSFLKKIIPSKLKDLVKLILNKSFLHHSIRSILIPSESISDFFNWSSEFVHIEFIAENTNAILNGQEEDIEHTFRFFSPNGNFLAENKYKKRDLIARIKLENQLSFGKFKYISFTHHTELKNSKVFKNKGEISKFRLKNQHRGYTIYFKERSNVGAAVHGNFGGITSKENKISRQRKNFIYTPIYKFDEQSKYHLVFNNPTSKTLLIKAFTLNNLEIKTISIPSMGNQFIEINNYSGGISFESKLPICRPLIFKNPPPSKEVFDVLHS